MNPEPFRIEPTFKPRIWGSRSLAPLYPEKTDLGEPIGEAWLTDVKCRVATGPFTGKALGEAWREMPAEWRGEKFAEPGDFPLLLKFIFPTDKLSIQVHPDDAYTSVYEKAAGGRGKTEMWHIVSAEPGASVLVGLKPGVSKAQFLSSLENHTLEDLLQRHSAAAGDTFFVPAGTPHTIGPGMVICEVQQYSDLTYRVYDYGRTDASGNLRELHLQKAIDVIDFSAKSIRKVKPQNWIDNTKGFANLIECPYFAVQRWELKSENGISFDLLDQDNRRNFVLMVALEGRGDVGWLLPHGESGHLHFSRGECWFIPATMFPSVAWRSQGKSTLLSATVPRR